ncbi:MAG: ATP-binding protein [Gemmatimonadaceae bacterium]
MTRAAVALSWSGGKDSALALQRLRASTEYEVTALLTSVTREYDRISIHGVRRSLLEEQAAALVLPLFEVALEPKSSDDAYQRAFRAALDELAASQPAVHSIAFGDLYLRDVRAYRDNLLADTAFRGLYPLWERPTRELAESFIADGFVATLVCVDGTQIDPSFAGRRFDRALLADLPPTADPCGENGEFHTFVHDGPIYARPIGVVTGEIVLREERFTYCDLLPA